MSLNRPLAGRSTLAVLHRATKAMHVLLADLEDAISELEGQMPPSQTISPVSPQDVDPVIDRVEDLRTACEELLRRSLRGSERVIVLNWAFLERDGALVPVGEILDLIRTLMSRPTPDGTLPSSLRWCDATVQTLARAPVALLRGRGARGKAAEISLMYEELADRLDDKEARS
jgi:hypothetical protein